MKGTSHKRRRKRGEKGLGGLKKSYTEKGRAQCRQVWERGQMARLNMETLFMEKESKKKKRQKMEGKGLKKVGTS